MARPLMATDDQILDAARNVLFRRGHDGFSVSEVAKEVGLSRSAIILRFDGASGLQSAVLERVAADFDDFMATCTAPPGPEGLLEIVSLIGRLVGSRRGLSLFMASFQADIQVPALAAFERRRGEALIRAIRRVMPPLPVAPEAAAAAFMAHIAGSLMAWQGSDVPEAEPLLRERTIQWMQIAGILPSDTTTLPCDEEANS